MEQSNHAKWYRVRLSYRADQAITGAAAVGGAFASALSGGEPTGNSAVDAVLLALTVALISLSAGAASRRLLAVVSAAAALVAFTPGLMALGFIAGAFAYASIIRHRDESAPGAITAAVALNVVLRWDLGGFFGLATLLGVALGAAMVVSGLRGAEPETRRVCAIGSGLVMVAVVVITGGAGLGARSAAREVAAAVALSERAVDRLDSGQHDEARVLLDASANRFERANGRFTGVFGRAARVIPIAAQHVRAGDRLTVAATDVARRTEATLAVADSDSLKLRRGRIDLDAVRSIEAPTTELIDSLDAARRTLDGVDSPWLVASFQIRLDDAASRFDARRVDLDVAADGVVLAPELLGEHGPRRYLVLFTTPSEARGLGGFIGNYAEITIDEGRIDVTRIGRRDELEAEIAARGADCAGCPEQYLREFGRFGMASGRGESTMPRSWSNLTMSPHFPDVASAAAVLYPQSGGRRIDGVIAVDPYVLEALMTYTGAVELPELGVTVESEGAAEYILRDQYLVAGDEAHDERIDALDQLAEAVIEGLLDGALPGPVVLARDLGPLVDERRLVAWSAHEAEQALFLDAGIAGALPPPDAAAFSVSVDNASASKIDAFLERSVTFEATSHEDGTTSTIAVVTLRNGAPSSGLPHYVIGNEIGLPQGFSRLLVTFYVPDEAGPSVVTVERDGQEVAFERGRVAEWALRRHIIELAPGQSTTYRVDLGVAADAVTAQAWEQPLAGR